MWPFINTYVNTLFVVSEDVFFFNSAVEIDRHKIQAVIGFLNSTFSQHETYLKCNSITSTTNRTAFLLFGFV